MRSIVLAVFSGLAGAALTGCASLEPEPCTGDWVKWRTDAITRDFRQDYQSEIRDLARFSRQLENPSPLLLLQMSARLKDFESMATQFSQTVMPDLRSAVEQCGTPTRFAGAFSDLLAEQGVDKTVLAWVEDAALLMEENGIGDGGA